MLFLCFHTIVLDLSDVTDKIANETFNAINGRIEDLCKVSKGVCTNNFQYVTSKPFI